MFSSLAALLLFPVLAAAATPLTEISFRTMDGKETTLKEYAGKVVLLVNVASRCGNTPQYAGLEKLYKELGPQGLVILGFPCNDFGAQEPGSNEEIKTFCTSQYAVTFPIFDKIHVKGPEQAPLYMALTGENAKYPGVVTWNFGKFLIGRNGEVLARFSPATTPDNAELLSAINAALKAP